MGQSPRVKYIILALSAGAAFHSGTAAAAVSIPLRLIRGYPVVGEVFINGKGPYNLLLDTGSESTIVDSELARELGLRPSFRVTAVTAGGAREAPGAVIPSIGLGGLAARDLEVVWYDMPAARLGGRVRGVLGQNFLSRFNYLLDFDGRKIVFEEGAEALTKPEDRRLRQEKMRGRVTFFSEPPHGRGRPLEWILDSGASDLVLFHNVESFEPLETTARAATNLGSRNATRGRIRILKIGGQVFCYLPAVLLQGLPEAASTAEDGLFPARLFHSIYVNNHEGYILLNPALTQERSARRGDHFHRPASNPTLLSEPRP